MLDSTLETARTSEFGITLVHYEVALVAALLELDPAELGLPPVKAADTPRQRATAALLESDLLGAADALAELGKVNDEAYLRLRAGERMLAEGRAEEGRAQVEQALVVLPRRPRNSIRHRGRADPHRQPAAVGLARCLATFDASDRCADTALDEVQDRHPLPVVETGTKVEGDADVARPE